MGQHVLLDPTKMNEVNVPAVFLLDAGREIKKVTNNEDFTNTYSSLDAPS